MKKEKVMKRAAQKPRDAVVLKPQQMQPIALFNLSAVFFVTVHKFAPSAISGMGCNKFSKLIATSTITIINASIIVIIQLGRTFSQT